jgi:hypothetical protein
MATTRRSTARGVRTLVILAAVLSGLIVGIIVISASGGDKRPTVYKPFKAGFAVRIIERIDQDGPIFYRDLGDGPNSFYLDLENEDLVALHYVPPGGDEGCVVQYDYEDDRRYEDCEGRAVDPKTLNRFPVTLEGKDDEVYVDLRRFESLGTPVPNR